MNTFLKFISKYSKISIPKRGKKYVKTKEEIEAMERHRKNWIKTN